ncbi:MAG: pseudaminic acid cytidylyltransferase [Bacteroidota bacterium]
MASIAIITARGGSKRIPRKNIKDFLGKPILAYSIETALTSGLFDQVIVSTDDHEIAATALKYGATVPFIRSLENSNDFAGTADVLIEVLEQLKKNGKAYEYACCIYPTAPFINPAVLKDGHTLLIEKKYDTVFPVCAFSYPILRSLSIKEEGKVEMNWPENLNKRSQDLIPAYHDAGQFYWVNVDRFIEKQKLFTDNSGALILNELQVQDIDTEIDWKIAELKYTLLNG